MIYFFFFFLPSLIVGLISLAWSIQNGMWPFVILAWALISGLGVAVGFHRIYSHRTHTLAPWLDRIVLLLGTLGGQGSSISWVAVHRGYHHRHSDTEKDLHSPIHGVFQAFCGWYLKVDEHTINHKYASELLRNKAHVFVHRHYFAVVASCMLVMLLINVNLLLVYLAALSLSLLQDNMVNVVCHTKGLGYKNWDTKDMSVNNPILGLLGWGQGWHENHHKFPNDYSFGKKWWEVDPAMIFIPLLKLGSTSRQKKNTEKENG